jgi:hypothetical protein
MRVVQPADLRLERAERDLECAADEAAREDVRLFVVQSAVDDALLGTAKLVVGRLTEPTFFPKRPGIESDKEMMVTRANRVRTVLSLGRGPEWKPRLGVAKTGRDSTIRFCLLPMCQGWISRLFLLRINFWNKLKF